MPPDLSPDLSRDVSPDAALIVRCRNVVRRYRAAASETVALDDVSVDVAPGTLVAIAGPSGSGKTTLLSIIGCLDRPDAGSVSVNGEDVAGLSRRRRRALRRATISMLLPLPSDNLLHGDDGAGNLRWAGRDRDDLGDEEVAELLATFDITACAAKRVRDMSGGEQQRLALACALVRRPVLVAADEPTSSLDLANARRVIDAFRRAVERGATVVVATHDPALIAAADSVVHLSHGRLEHLPQAGRP